MFLMLKKVCIYTFKLYYMERSNICVITFFHRASLLNWIVQVFHCQNVCEIKENKEPMKL